MWVMLGSAGISPCTCMLHITCVHEHMYMGMLNMYIASPELRQKPTAIQLPPETIFSLPTLIDRGNEYALRRKYLQRQTLLPIASA